MFQCYSLKLSHLLLLPLCPQICSLHLCLLCCPVRRPGAFTQAGRQRPVGLLVEQKSRLPRLAQEGAAPHLEVQTQTRTSCTSFSRVGPAGRPVTPSPAFQQLPPPWVLSGQQMGVRWAAQVGGARPMGRGSRSCPATMTEPGLPVRHQDVPAQRCGPESHGHSPVHFSSIRRDPRVLLLHGCLRMAHLTVSEPCLWKGPCPF